MKISPQWTPSERLQIVSVMLNAIAPDIYAGTYSAPGRPNITSVQHIIHESPQVLEANRASLEHMVAELEADADAPGDTTGSAPSTGLSG